MSLKIKKEKAGFISPTPIWVAFHQTKEGLFLYEHISFFKLLIKIIREWKLDRHLIG